MNRCWGEGELRAWIDREVEPEQAAEMETHLAGCARCASQYETLAARASLVSSWMNELSPEIPGPRVARKSGISRPAVWTAVAALAAALAGFAILARTPKPVPVQAIIQPPAAPPAALELPVGAAAIPLSRPSIRRTAPARTSVARAHVAYYVALDEEPIDTGLVMRVALPSGMQADVIVDGDGRARAIRPVQNSLKEYEP